MVIFVFFPKTIFVLISSVDFSQTTLAFIIGMAAGCSSRVPLGIQVLYGFFFERLVLYGFCNKVCSAPEEKEPKPKRKRRRRARGRRNRNLGFQGSQRQSCSRPPPTNTQAPHLPSPLFSPLLSLHSPPRPALPAHTTCPPPRSAPLPRLRAPAPLPSPPRIPDLAAARLASASIALPSRAPSVPDCVPCPAAMVSGGCVGAEVEVDPEAAAAAAGVERDEAVAPAPARELVVGYALTSKKAKSFLQPKLRGLAR